MDGQRRKGHRRCVAAPAAFHPVGAHLAGEGDTAVQQAHRAAFFASKLRSHQDGSTAPAPRSLWEHSLLAKGTPQSNRHTAPPSSLASYAPTRRRVPYKHRKSVGAQLAGEGDTAVQQVHRAAFFASKLRSHQDGSTAPAPRSLWEHSLLAKETPWSNRYTALPSSLASYAPTRTRVPHQRRVACGSTACWRRLRRSPTGTPRCLFR